MKIFRKIAGCLICLLVSLPGFADIPQAPSIPGADTGDFLQIGMSIFKEGAGMSLTVIYVSGLLGYSALVLGLLWDTKKTKEWGHFFKWSGIGLAVLVGVVTALTLAKAGLGG